MKIVAVTACVAGIAHTFMAKAGLEKAAKAKGFNIKVETQGSMGAQNKISPKEVAEADVVIFAVDTNVANKDRFNGKPTIKVKVAEAVKNADELLKKAEELVLARN